MKYIVDLEYSSLDLREISFIGGSYLDRKFSSLPGGEAYEGNFNVRLKGSVKLIPLVVGTVEQKKKVVRHKLLWWSRETTKWVFDEKEVSDLRKKTLDTKEKVYKAWKAWADGVEIDTKEKGI